MNDPHNPMNNNDKNQYKNLLMFFIMLVAAYMIYDHFVVQPRIDALELANKQKQEEQPQKAMNIAKEKIKARNLIIEENDRIVIENGMVNGSINLRGGRIDDILLKQYYKTIEKKENVELLSPANTKFPQYIEMGWITSSKTLELPSSDTIWKVAGHNSVLSKGKSVTIFWENKQNIRFEKEFNIDENYLISVEQRVINKSDNEYVIYPYSLISRHGRPKNYIGNLIMHEGLLGYIGDELYEISYKDLEKDADMSITANNGGWVGIVEKYWFTGIIPKQDEEHKYRFTHTQGKEGIYRTKYQVDVTGSAVSLAAGKVVSYTDKYFVGPKKLNLLEQYEKELGIKHFDLVVDFGWLYFMTKPFYYVIMFLNQYVGNFGVAIIIFTVMLRFLVFPLANTSYRSFANMRKVAPQIVELRDIYKDDKVRLQKELMELYQREGVNPMAGCLPILLQIPIFFAMYKVLYVAIEMRHAPFFGWIHDLSAPDPTSFVNLFGLLPFDAPSILQIGIWPCLMLIGLLMQRQMNPPPQDPLQRHMMMFFPFFITYILSGFASGLVIYWTVSNFLSVLQQYIIMKSMGVEVHFFSRPKVEEKLDDMVKDGPDIHPALEKAKEEVEDALFGEEEETKEITPPKPKKKKKKKK